MNETKQKTGEDTYAQVSPIVCFVSFVSKRNETKGNGNETKLKTKTKRNEMRLGTRNELAVAAVASVAFTAGMVRVSWHQQSPVPRQN